jgi:large subunit ribosomal protein L15
MDLSNLKPARGSVKNGKRLGRGQGSGRGGTSTRGHKGAKSRSGYSKKIGTIQTLAEKLDVEIIDFQTLVTAGLVSKNALVKILGQGEIAKKLEVHAHAFSKSAVAAIEAKQGTVVKI